LEFLRRFHFGLTSRLQVCAISKSKDQSQFEPDVVAFQAVLHV
jgi:hypothetical protein